MSTAGRTAAHASTTRTKRSLKGSWKRSCLAAGLALLTAGASGCDDDVNYGYFAVTVTIADTATPEYLARISACGVNVEGSDSDFTTLGCQAGQVSKNVGTFEWSTNATGSVRFVVRLTDITDTEVGTGSSGDVTIVPGGAPVKATVVVAPTAAALMPRQ